MGIREDYFKAVTAGDTEKVKTYLIQNPKLASSRNKEKYSGVMLAAYNGKLEIIDLLLTSGAKLDIYEACAVGQLDTIESSLKQKPDCINQYSYDGWTPLHLAAFFGHKEAVEILLEKGADTEIRSKSNIAMGNMPLHAAVASNRKDIVKLLVEKGANVNARQIPGNFTPLHIATFNNLDIVKLLISKGADVNARTDTGKTPLAIAMQTNNQGIIDILRKHGANA